MCYAYTDVQVDEAAAAHTLPEDGVPEVIVEEAHHMTEAQFFKPNLDGPASERVPEATEPDLVTADKDTQGAEEGASGEQDPPQEDDEEQKMKNFLQDVESMSENLIGLDEAHTHDPLRQILSLQKQMQLLQEEGHALLRRQAKLHSNSEETTDSKHSLHVAVQGSIEQCKQHFLSIREVAKQNMGKWTAAIDKVAAEAEQEALRDGKVATDAKLAADLKVKANEDPIFKVVVIGTDYLDERVQAADRAEITRLVAEGAGVHIHTRASSVGDHWTGSGAAAASERQLAAEDGAKGLNVRAGKALSTMSSLSWVYSFVEFFYGDCLPMQPGRPQELPFEEVFRYLLEREELEYAVPGDATRYEARPMSRWDSPEFVMLFASTLRSLKLLRAAKLSFLDGDRAKSFRADLQALAAAKAEDFEEILEHDKSKNSHSLLSLLQSPHVRQKKTISMTH